MVAYMQLIHFYPSMRIMCFHILGMEGEIFCVARWKFDIFTKTKKYAGCIYVIIIKINYFSID